MKFAPFEYASPQTLDEAVRLLGNENAKALAGGQSLLPTMAFRLATPGLLVDLARIPGLDRIELDESGARLGARVRWRDIEKNERLARAQPLLAAAIAHVAHYQIRNRGTVGGSLAHADPAAEMPGVAVACDAILEVIGKRGRRSIEAGRFFTGALSTALAQEELIVSVRLPAWPATRRWAFEEFARRRGDFAMAGALVFYDYLDGRATNAHIGVIGACTRPHRIAAAEALLNGSAVDDAAIQAAARAAEKAIDPPSDLHASAEYRRSLFGTLLERALAHSRRRS
ncbi:MAG TPA: xanthine dehydrogenase family protein subunit M [Burkholderiales bacterium]